MPELEVEVKTVKVKYMCDDCDEEQVFTGVSNPMAPPIYHHTCKNGHHMKKSGKAYPFNRFVEVSEEAADDGHSDKDTS